MHYNILSFWQQQENLPSGHPDKLGPRTNRLLQYLFEQWRNKPAWPDWGQMGHLFDRYAGAELDTIRQQPVAIRKGLAIKHMLTELSDNTVAVKKGLMQVHPDELIIGSLPPYSVGQGKELMRYLTEEEALYYEIRYLNEWSPFGHIVPDHQRILDHGIDHIIAECRQKIGETEDAKKKAFHTSVILALEGVLGYAANYAALARTRARLFLDDAERHAQFIAIAQRLEQAPRLAPRTFAEAVQCIYLVHCALHYSGEIVPLGRLDQLLYPFYKSDRANGTLTEEQAREILECLWIKLDEKTILNARHLEDRFTSSDGALLGTGSASNFDQGALANQWMQQVTIGGVIADNEPGAKDATNDITLLCLETARRLPFNSPTLDLRVHSNTPAKVLDLAAAALLSGGAHPVLLNDDKIIPALQFKTGGTVELKSARNYACDGCYETLFAGETEFSFGFVAALDVLEKALNSGAGFSMSGPVYLRGMKGSWRTPPAAGITSYAQFQEILRSHILMGCHKFLHGILVQYGIKEDVSPSPLLSAIIGGCVASGRDLAGGGARYHLFSPLMTGISTATDSLYIIKYLVFEQQLFSLEELVACLRSNWGNNPLVTGLQLSKERITQIRALCLQQPKFGYGHEAVDALSWELIDTFYQCMEEARQAPVHQPQWEALKARYDIPGRPFEILFAPGVGTFEQYVFGGSFAGATPDGRLAFSPIASDLSPAPVPADQPAYTITGPAGNDQQVDPVRTGILAEALKSYTHNAINYLSDGAPSDFNIPENFPQEKLAEVLRSFANGQGSNVMTITTANPKTMYLAALSPEQYELLRVRMGGWTEFFITLFPDHKAQHQHRPVFLPH